MKTKTKAQGQPRLPDPEIRTATQPIEVREDGESRRLAGYAALFDTPATLGTFEERIAVGAFTATLGRDDVRALFNHDPNLVLGRTSNGTLQLQEDSRGLRYEVTLPDTTWARDLWASVQRGDITQSSFAFAVEADGEDWKRDRRPPQRILTAVRLFDVSPVTYPAYAQTTVSARAEARAAELLAAADAGDLAATAGARYRYVTRRIADRAEV